MAQVEPTSVEVTAIGQEYPDWHVWRSQAGRWWATRLGHNHPASDPTRSSP